MEMKSESKMMFGHELTCPYCHNRQTYFNLTEGFNFVCCYPDYGGCDADFCVKIELVVDAKYYKMEEAKSV